MPSRDPTETGKVIQMPRGQEVEERQFDPLRRHAAGELNLLIMQRLLRRYVFPLFLFDAVRRDPARLTANASAFLGRHLRADYSVGVDVADLILHITAEDATGEFSYGISLREEWFTPDAGLGDW